MEGLTTLKKELKLTNIKQDSWKASTIPLKKRCDDQQTISENLVTDVKELQHEVEGHFDDCVSLMSGWFREERQRNRTEIDEIQKELAGHDKQFIRIQNAIAEQVEKIAKNENDINETHEGLVGLAEDCAGYGRRFTEHNNRLSAHEDRHTANDVRHAGHDRNFAEINARILQMEKNIDKGIAQYDELKGSHENLKGQYDEQQKLTKQLNARVDDLTIKLDAACEARDLALKQNQANIEFIANERIETTRLEQKLEDVLAEQKKMKQDHQESQAHIDACMQQISTTNNSLFETQAAKLEALKTETVTLVARYTDIEPRVLYFKDLPARITRLEAFVCQKQSELARDIQARLQTLEEQSIHHTGLKDWQARMEIYFQGTRDTIFTWARSELKEHHTSLASEIGSLKAQSESQEKDVKTMSKRLEDQDLKYLTLRALVSGKTIHPSTNTTSLSPKKFYEEAFENSSAWRSSPTLMIADTESTQQEKVDAIPDTSDEPENDNHEIMCTMEPETAFEQSEPVLQPSAALYDPCAREILRDPSPAVDETVQKADSPLSSIPSSVLAGMNENTGNDQQFGLSETLSCENDDSQPDHDHDLEIARDLSVENGEQANAPLETGCKNWTEEEFQILQDTMRGIDNTRTQMRQRFRICEKTLRDKGFNRTWISCKIIWYSKFATDDRSSWNLQQRILLKDAMEATTEDWGHLSGRERFEKVSELLSDTGKFSFVPSAWTCWHQWHRMQNSEDLDENITHKSHEQLDERESILEHYSWLDEEIRILREVMDETEGILKSTKDRSMVCSRRLWEKGFIRSPQACAGRMYRSEAVKLHTGIWTEDQKASLRDAVMKTVKDYGHILSLPRFVKVSEILNNTHGATVVRTPNACKRYWVRIRQEEQWRIEGEQESLDARSSVRRKRRSARSMAVVDSGLEEESDNDHNSQASNLLEHLMDEQDQPSRKRQKQVSPSSHQSANIEEFATKETEPSTLIRSGLTSVPCHQETQAPLPSTAVSTEDYPAQRTNLSQSQSMDGEPDYDRIADSTTEQTVHEQVSHEQAFHEQPSAAPAIEATVDSFTDQHDNDDSEAETIRVEFRRPSSLDLQGPNQTPGTMHNAVANFRCYEQVQESSGPDVPAQGNLTESLLHEQPTILSLSQSKDSQEDTHEDVSAADLADIVADEIAEHCEENTAGFSSIDIGFWIADDS